LEILYAQGYEKGKQQFLLLPGKEKYAPKEADWNAEETKAEKAAKKAELKETISNQ